MKSIYLAVLVIGLHLLTACDKSSTSSPSSSPTSSQTSANSLAGAWQDEKSGIVIHLQEDGSLYMSQGQDKKGEGNWSVSGDRLKIQFTIHGAPMGDAQYMQFRQTDKNHLVLTESNGKVDRWTRQ